MAEEHREIVHHSVIGSLVAVGLAWSDEAIHEWFKNAFQAHPDWVRAAILAVIFIVAFCVIALIETYWSKKEKANFEAPLSLTAVGKVDGFWLDAIWTEDGKEPIEGSVIEITSSRRRFVVTGTTYEAPTLLSAVDLSKVEPVGDFSGEGIPWSEDGFSYQYNGQESGKGLDRGTGFYRFWRDAADRKVLRFDGAFLGLHIKQSRFVKGRMVIASEMGELRKDSGKQLLKAFLAGKQTR